MLAASEFPDVLGRTWCTWVSGALAVPVPRNSQTSLWRMEITVKVGDMLSLLAAGHRTTKGAK